MLEAAFWGFVGGAALIVGAAIGLWLPVPRRAVGLVMAFGAGVLISAISFELTEEAFAQGGGIAVALGMAAGALTFFAGDWLIERRGGRLHHAAHDRRKEGGATAMVLGAVLDGIPESVVIGISLLGGSGVGLPVVAAVFLSNVPESLASATGMKQAGHSTRRIFGIWGGVAIVSAAAAGLGYAVLGDASPQIIAAIQAFAAGAMLTMLADTMMPEAFAHGGNAAGLATALGFASAFFLSSFG